MTVIQAEDRFRELSENARRYPSYLLGDHKTALALFAAGFLGWNDVVHFARAGMTVTCVDTDADKLWEMATIYPAGWSWRVDDAWAFAEHHAREGIMYDVVSVDPFFGDAAEQAWDTLYLWVELARHLVTLTIRSDTVLNTPDGWKASTFPRNSNAAWLVLQRA